MGDATGDDADRDAVRSFAQWVDGDGLCPLRLEEGSELQWDSSAEGAYQAGAAPATPTTPRTPCSPLVLDQRTAAKSVADAGVGGAAILRRAFSIGSRKVGRGRAGGRGAVAHPRRAARPGRSAPPASWRRSCGALRTRCGIIWWVWRLSG